ncbi:HdaA/DnaA family protein [Iodidimonas nitroreducens]|nr:DnaA/Hda family protein [Iodidimonas nitroreducens]
MMMYQLPLDLPHRQSFRGEDFFIAPSNAAAVAMIDHWPDWSSHALAVIGPPASGKSHLAAVWQQKSGADRVAPENIGARSRLMIKPHPAVIVEDADKALAEGRLDPVDFFHLYNWIRERQGHLLISGRLPPARWGVRLNDLRSRLIATPVAAIEAPDDALLAALMVKRLNDRQLRTDPKVLDYVLPRIERSFDGVEQIVAALDKASLSQKKPLTLPLARAVLAAAGL